MALHTVDKDFNPDAVAELVKGGFANVPFLAASGAVNYNPTLPIDPRLPPAKLLNRKILVPYATAPAEWDEYVDGAPLAEADIAIGSADGLSTDPEEAPVRRIGVRENMTTWAAANPLDPAGTLRSYILMGWAQKVDTMLIKAGADITSPNWVPVVIPPGGKPTIGKYSIDVSNIPDPNGQAGFDGALDHSSIILARGTTGAEGWNSNFVLGIVHSHTMDMLFSRVNKMGVPGYLMEDTGQTIGDAAVYRMTSTGTLILVTDKQPMAGQKYISTFYKRNSIALYQNTEVSTGTVYNPATDANDTGFNNYLAIHRYFRLNERAHAGVVNIIHN
jgi:hypothetical protein